MRNKMNYEEEYKHALERAKAVKETYYNLGNISAIAVLESIFPELKESEDERIRKFLIKCVQQPMGSNFLDGIKKDDVIAWLEKQGEKSTNKVEPKFKVGDKIIHKELGGDFIHNPHKIIQVDMLDKKYRLEDGLVAHFSEEDDWELVEQKPAWSKEDERICRCLIKYQEKALDDVRNDKYGHSEIISDLKEMYRERIDWLKSIKPNHWKPSEEQLRAIINSAQGLYQCKEKEVLLDLYEQLKKL